jgi:iron complex outermembrane receptor protein
LASGDLLLGEAPLAAAQEASEKRKLDAVYVTGSNVARTDIETALPIQVITREDIERSGAISAAALMSQISANLIGITDAIFIGNGRPGLSTANLRGLGEGSTLVLLNGRRLANHATTGGAFNLNFIPVAAIERVEILKDGASAIYGADAMAGVINFVLRKDFSGVQASAYAAVTEHGGGNQQQATVTAGYGDLTADRFNVFVIANYQNNEALPARDRPFSSTAYRPDEFIDNGRDRDATFPANIRIGSPDSPLWVNPSFATGCMPPFSVPVSGKQSCGYDHLSFVNLLPPVERTNALAGATWQIAPDHQLFAQYLYSHDQYERMRHVPYVARDVAPDRLPIFLYPAGGPFYPTEFAAAQGISGALELYYRPFPLGPATDQIRTEAQYLVAGAQGLVGGWNYNAAFTYSQNTVKNSTSGNVSARRLSDAFATGLVNPFGPSGLEGEALLADTAWSGELFQDKASTGSLEAKASNDIYQLPAGPLAVAVGLEARHEELDIVFSPEATSGDILNLPQNPSTTGRRTVAAIYAEFNVPIARGFEAQLALRYDHYSDVGGTTNPKVAVRWQPNAAWLMRASYGTGFRAPTLADLRTPPASLGYTALQRDPRRCIIGTEPDCRMVFRTLTGGDPDLQPEESTQWNLGVVWEPVPGFSIGVDYWKINKTNTIGALTDQQIFTNFDLFEAAHIVRYQGSPTLPIKRVIQITQNLGDLWTSGIDVDVALRGPVTSFGRLSFNLNGTYIDKWQQQLDGVHYIAAVGRSIVVGAVPRWRHYATLYWNYGPWGATLAQVYSSGYTEINPTPTQSERKVGAYDIWNLQGTYSGLKNTIVTLGIKNLFDRAPPFSNQNSQGVVMFDPRYADPRGRLFYAQVAVSFK